MWNEISRVVSVEAMAWRNVEAVLASAPEPSQGEKVKVNSSNDVSKEAFGGKRAFKLPDVESRLRVLRFEAWAVYTYVKSGH